MSDGTHIQWTDASWPVTAGCEVVSDGCERCYAATLTSTRLRHLPDYAGLAVGGKFTGEVRLAPHKLDWPLKWRKPRRIFVASMSDLFHSGVPDEYIARVFAVMAATPQHSYQVLTKRHARMRSLLSSESFRERVHDALVALPPNRATLRGYVWPLPKVWVGISVESQQWADIRIPALLGTPAAVRWVSAEPLLEAVDLSPWLPSISWVVIGGESGAGARPFELEWARSLVAQCHDAGVPVFCKQFGSVWAKANGGHSKGGDMALWPEDLQVREYPNEKTGE